MNRRTIQIRALVLALFVVGWAAPAVAQDAEVAVSQEDKLLQDALAEQEPDAAKVEAPDMGYTATVMLFGAGVLALAGWGVRRFYNGKQQGISSDIEVIDTISLDGGDKLSLVEVDGRRILVGRSSGAMNSLDAWPVAPASGEPVVASSPAQQTSTHSDKAQAVDAFFDSAPSDFGDQLERARQNARSEGQTAGRDGSRERDSVLVSLRALEAKHGGNA